MVDAKVWKLIPAEPFKTFQPTDSISLSRFHFSDQMNLFVCLDDRKISTSEIVICSLFIVISYIDL